MTKWHAGLNWRKLAPVPILSLVTEYCELPEQQVVVLFQILAAEINFGYKFQTVRCALLSISVSVGLFSVGLCMLVQCNVAAASPPVFCHVYSAMTMATLLHVCLHVDKLHASFTSTRLQRAL